MCGICGAISIHPSFDASNETVTRMRETIAHRGPDGYGTWAQEDGRVALGHRRLSIIDLSTSGAQPMSNEDGTVWITYNGEVYNHAALRHDLERRGHVYRSETDTETVLHLYEEEGPACVEALDGMFAFAIWDARRDSLFLARDRLGVKPLYFARPPGGFVFASEVKSIYAHPSVPRELDEEAFSDYLTFGFVPAPGTLTKGVEKLAPAERAWLNRDGTLRRETYWSPFSPSTEAEVGAMTERDAQERLLELLSGSVEKRMMSDVPFGVFLSGGLDSSTNVALMSQLTDAPVRTFSTAPAEHSRYDELGYARVIADAFETDHHEIRVSHDDVERFLPELAASQDEPLCDPTAIPQHFVSRLARDTGTPVVQIGEGSDELFHGYRGYAQHRLTSVPLQRWIGRAPRRGMARLARRTADRSGRGNRYAELLWDAAESSVPYWGGALCFRGPRRDELTRVAASSPDPLRVPERLWAEAASSSSRADVFQKMTYVELKQRLPELLLMRLDRTAMLSSVEAREPFLDHRLVEFAVALPPGLKYRRRQGKYLLKRAVGELLPSEIVWRPKQGFGAPISEWMRTRFGVHAREVVERSSLVERGLLDRALVGRLFEIHAARRDDWGHQLWNLYIASVWHDRWVAGSDLTEHRESAERSLAATASPGVR